MTFLIILQAKTILALLARICDIQEKEHVHFGVITMNQDGRHSPAIDDIGPARLNYHVPKPRAPFCTLLAILCLKLSDESLINHKT